MSTHAARTKARREAVPAMAVALAFATARSTRSGSSVAAPPGSFSFLLRNLANAAALFVAKAPPGWANLQNESYSDVILFSEESHSRISVQTWNHVPSIILGDIIHDISSTNITTWSNELVKILRPTLVFNFFSISRSIHFSRYMYIIGIAAKLHPFQRKVSRFLDQMLQITADKSILAEHSKSEQALQLQRQTLRREIFHQPSLHKF